MKKKTLVSVIIPVYNENSTILELIQKVNNVKFPGVKFQIVVVESNSDDGSREIVKKFENNKKFILIFQPFALGKGSAVIEGLKKANGDIIIIQDSDLEYNPNDYEIMLKPIIKNKTDFVLGSRVKNGAFRIRNFKNQIFKSYLYNFSHILLTFFFNILYKQKLKDPWTCYKVFKKEVIDSFTINENRFGVEPEITSKVARGKWRIYEVGISYYGRDYSEGKKIGWKDAVRAFYVILKYGILRLK